MLFGDFRPQPTVTEQVLGNLPQAITILHHIALVGGLYGILSVLSTREPRQRYSTRQTVQVDAVVDTLPGAPATLEYPQTSPANLLRAPAETFGGVDRISCPARG